MKCNFSLFYLLVIYKLACAYDKYISGGVLVKYSQYPHAVFIDVRCDDEESICGGSILNQYIILTAAHCLERCNRGKRNRLMIGYGHEDISHMTTTPCIKFLQHKDYDIRLVTNDICLCQAKHMIALNDFVKRIIIMKHPPVAKYGYIAGWGADETGAIRNQLKYTSAQIQEPSVCALMTKLPPGAFCAGPVTGVGTPLEGDSGGALVVDDYIQIGIVSFSVDTYSLVAYTNVSYYLNWITKNSKKLVCNKSLK